MVHYWCLVNDIKDTGWNNVYHNIRYQKEAEERGLIVTAAPGIDFSETTPSPELRTFVIEMGWDNKLQLYRNTREAKDKNVHKKICRSCLRAFYTGYKGR